MQHQDPPTNQAPKSRKPRSWRTRRQTTQLPDGQQRWDRAYQYLLRWSTPPATPPTLSLPTTKELDDEPTQP